MDGTQGSQSLAVDRKDWLLSAIAQSGTDGLSPIQIQKIMFLLKMEAKKHVGAAFYEFEAYNYGPFNSTIYRDVETLVEGGFVRQESAGSYARVMVTSSGLTEAKRLKTALPEGGRKYLKSVVKWVSSVSFNQLLKSIYAKYPEYAVNSVFRH